MGAAGLLLLLLGCRSPGTDSTAPPPPAPVLGTWTEVPCTDLPADLALAAPTVWAEASPAFDAYLDWLQESPNRLDEVGDPERIIDDLSVVGDQLVVGLGDWGYNTGSLYCHDRGGRCPWEDADGHGIPLLAFGGLDEEAAVLGIVEEEEVERMRRLGEGIWPLSTDPSRGDAAPDCADLHAQPPCMEEWFRDHPRYYRASAYRLDEDGLTTGREVIPDAFHVFDLALHDGVLHAVGAGRPADDELGPGESYQGSYAMAWRSDDAGASWQIAWHDENVPGKRRLDALLPVGDRLFALGHHDDPDGEVPLRLELVEGAWVAASEDPLPALEGTLSTAALDDATALAWGTPVAGQSARAWAVQADDAGTLTRWPLPLADLGDGARLVDAWLLCAGDLLLLTRTNATDGYAHVVYRTADLQQVASILTWTGPESVASMAWWQDGLALGAREHLLLHAPRE